ncbi:hypothetical protein GCM10029978_016130 [Actinoallomurus acanthiterrae]
MALIVLAADKGAPGVTTAAVAIAAVWPRPVMLAECDQAGGDLVYRLPGEDGGMLNPARGMLSLAATARRGLRAEQIWEHTQRLVGGLDVLVGLTNAEQAQGLTWLWGPLGRAFADLTVPGPPREGAAPPVNGGPPGPVSSGGVSVDVIADCGRLGAGSVATDLLREASTIVLFTRATLEHVAHLRERINSLASELGGHAAPPIGVVVVADPREYRTSLTEVGRIISNAKLPASVLGGFALDPKGAEMLRGRWGGRLDRSLLIRSARQIAGGLARAAGGPETGREGQGAASGSQSR